MKTVACFLGAKQTNPFYYQKFALSSITFDPQGLRHLWDTVVNRHNQNVVEFVASSSVLTLRSWPTVFWLPIHYPMVWSRQYLAGFTRLFRELRIAAIIIGLGFSTPWTYNTDVYSEKDQPFTLVLPGETKKASFKNHCLGITAEFHLSLLVKECSHLIKYKSVGVDAENIFSRYLSILIFFFLSIEATHIN